MFNKPVLLVAVVSVVAEGCSPILSRRTDEQAWLEYQKEMQSERAPAAQSKSAASEPEALKKLHQALEEIPSRSLLLTCQKSDHIQSCFQDAMEVQFNKVFQKTQKLQDNALVLNDVVYKSELKLFRNRYSFDQVFSEVQNFHQRLLSGMDLRAVEHVRLLQTDCEGRKSSDSEIREYHFFNGGSTEVPKGQYVCINEKWESDIRQLLDETTERLGLQITSKEAREWIRKYQVDPVYNQETQNYFNRKKEEQLALWKAHAALIEQELDYHLSMNEFVKTHSRKYREEYSYLALEPLLTQLYQAHQGKK